MAPQLTNDGGNRERGERRAVFGTVPLDRLEHTEHRDLFEIVEWFVAIRKPPGERTRQLDVVLDECVARVRCARESVSRPLQEAESAAIAVIFELVLVGDHVDDGARELAQLGWAPVRGAGTLDLDQAVGGEETQRERRARTLVADECVRKLVDRDALIFEVAEGETGACSRVGSRQSGETEVHGMAGNREGDRSVV